MLCRNYATAYLDVKEEEDEDVKATTEEVDDRLHYRIAFSQPGTAPHFEDRVRVHMVALESCLVNEYEGLGFLCILQL